MAAILLARMGRTEERSKGFAETPFNDHLVTALDEIRTILRRPG